MIPRLVTIGLASVALTLAVTVDAQLPDPKQAARQIRPPGGQAGKPGSSALNLSPSSYTNPEVERKLMAIVFPKFFVKDKPARDLAADLAAASKQVGQPLTFEVYRENMIRPITIDAEDIMLSRILMRMVEASGNSCYIQETPTGIRVIGW